MARKVIDCFQKPAQTGKVERTNNISDTHVKSGENANGSNISSGVISLTLVLIYEPSLDGPEGMFYPQAIDGNELRLNGWWSRVVWGRRVR